MDDRTPPAARFQKFEIVSIAGCRWDETLVGRRGTIIWCDPPDFDRRARAWKEWIYCLSLEAPGRNPSFLESHLEPTGEFDTEQSHLGHRYEISYDIVMEDDTPVIEGTFRLPEHPWQVFGFWKKAAPELRHSFEAWRSGITGIVFDVPDEMVLDRDLVIRAMSEVFGSAEWVEVSGPYSPVLL